MLYYCQWNQFTCDRGNLYCIYLVFVMVEFWTSQLEFLYYFELTGFKIVLVSLAVNEWSGHV